MGVVTSKQEALAVISRSAPRLAELGVVRVALFGSFAREEQTAGSDVDLLVTFSEGRKSFAALMEVSEYLESLLGRRVEVLTPESLSRHIGPRIRQEAEDVPLAG